MGLVALIPHKDIPLGLVRGGHGGAVLIHFPHTSELGSSNPGPYVG